jgi:YggT family protein
MLNPFINLIGEVLYLYSLCIIIWIVMTTLVSFKILNASQPIVWKIMDVLNRLIEPALKPIRKKLPDLGGVDISPIILILLLNFVREALYTYLYNL